MGRFQLYKVVRNGRLIHCASVMAKDRIEAIDFFKKEYNVKIVLGSNFYNYYVTGLIR